MLELHEIARRYIGKAAPAISGQGGHDQTFSVAYTLIKGFDFSVSEAQSLFHEYNQRCEPPWTEAELEHKLQSADAAADVDGAGNFRPRGWLLPAEEFERRPQRSSPARPIEPKPEFSPGKLKKLGARWRPFIDAAWLADRSLVNPYRVSPEKFLGTLYRKGEKVLIFTNAQTQGQALWPRERIPQSGPNGVWFLIQPVDGEWHPNPRQLDTQGVPTNSRRSEESVTAWRYLCLESDLADPRDWVSALVQLPLAIAAIYTSGRRSIHALIRIDVGSLDDWREFARANRRVLVMLGADRQVASTAVRLSRLPGCQRGKRLQKLLYLNPDPEARAIITLAPVRDVLRPAITYANVKAFSSAADAIEAAGAKNLEDCIKALDARDRIRAADPAPALELLEWFESSPTARKALTLLNGEFRRQANPLPGS